MRILTLLIVTLLISQVSSAQSKDELYQNFSDHICSCVDEVLVFVDSDVRKVFIDVEGMSETESDTYFNSLSPDLLSKIVTQANQVAEESTSTEISDCITKYEEKLTDKQLEIMGIDDSDDESFNTAMEVLLEKMSSDECKFTQSIIRTGLNAEE